MKLSSCSKCIASYSFLLCIGCISSSCGYANRKRSDGRHEGQKLYGELNGLGNNGNRCHANATLQLLAALFSEEIKNVKPFQGDSRKEQIRLGLCTVVDHINTS